MAFKYFSLLLLVAAASAGIIPVEHHEIPLEHLQQHHQPAVYHAAAPLAHVSAPHTVHYVPKQQIAHEQYPDDPHPQYNFAYDVQDAVSGDSKSQTESRDGDVVHGEYSLNDADGFRRTVKYTADSVNGFNAVVQREPLTHKVVAAAPVQYHHVPTAAVVKTPVAYGAVPVHHEVPTHTTYEVPQHDDHHYYHH